MVVRAAPRVSDGFGVMCQGAFERSRRVGGCGEQGAAVIDGGPRPRPLGAAAKGTTIKRIRGSAYLSMSGSSSSRLDISQPRTECLVSVAAGAVVQRDCRNSIKPGK